MREIQDDFEYALRIERREDIEEELESLNAKIQEYEFRTRKGEFEIK